MKELKKDEDSVKNETGWIPEEEVSDRLGGRWMKLCYTPEALHDLSEIKQYINIFFYRIENKNVSAYRIINIRTGYILTLDLA